MIVENTPILEKLIIYNAYMENRLFTNLFLGILLGMCIIVFLAYIWHTGLEKGIKESIDYPEKFKIRQDEFLRRRKNL